MHGARRADGFGDPFPAICNPAVASQKVPDRESGKRSAVAVPKHDGIGLVGAGWLGRDQFAQEPDSPRPQRAKADLAAFAE